MGASNDIRDSNITAKLVDLACDKCSQQFTKEDIKEQNFDLYFDNSNDVKLIPMKDLTEHDYYFPTGRKGYQLTIWIRTIEHLDCQLESCEKCWEQYPAD